MTKNRFPVLHPWRISSQRARAIQSELRERVVLKDNAGRIKRVAGVDVGFEDGNSTARAAVVVLRYPELTELESAVARRKVNFPYIPGYLSFREIPSILSALSKVRVLPDLILCDGQGYAHPRRFGLACHLGVITSIPTIGVAKTRLLGIHQPVGLDKGDWKYLVHQTENIGVVLRSRSNINPVYVSVGHKISLSSAIRYTINCCTRYRLPETTRAAHRLASAPGR